MLPQNQIMFLELSTREKNSNIYIYGETMYTNPNDSMAIDFNYTLLEHGTMFPSLTINTLSFGDPPSNYIFNTIKKKFTFRVL